MRFDTQVTDLLTESGQVCGVKISFADPQTGALTEERNPQPCGGVGHWTQRKGYLFHAVKTSGSYGTEGVCGGTAHPASPEDDQLLSVRKGGCGALGAANYKATRQTKSGRGVYSFCMCPGGYVVNASSEEGRLAVNGMSYHDRAGENANSALIVTVTPRISRRVGP